MFIYTCPHTKTNQRPIWAVPVLDVDSNKAAVMSLMVRFIPGLAVVLLGYTGYRLYAANALYNKRTLAGLAVAAGPCFLFVPVWVCWRHLVTRTGYG